MRGKARKRRRISIAYTSIVAIALMIAVDARAQYLTVYGGPTYDATTTTGYRSPLIAAFSTTAEGGFGAGMVSYFSSGSNKGVRAVRWDASGSAIELGNLGTSSVGSTMMRADSVNASGEIVGYAAKFVSGASVGLRAVRWDASGTPTELTGLGVSGAGFANSQASDINDSGMMAGSVDKYVAGVYMGPRPVLWNASGTPTELAILGTDNTGMTRGAADSMNGIGQTVGTVQKYVAGTLVSNDAPVRWDANGAVTELGNLDSSAPFGLPTKINSSGTAVGSVNKYVANVAKGTVAVRWDASGSAATELDNLGLDNSGSTSTEATYINSSGTIVGAANKYSSGIFLGQRPVRWDASGTAITELGILGTDSSGSTVGGASAINDAGITVGAVTAYDNAGNSLGSHAVMWGPDALAIDLNTLIDPSSGWILSSAFSISNDDWVTGIGAFDPDGTGPMAAYNRLFLIQVPEPSSLILLGIGTLTVVLRRRSIA